METSKIVDKCQVCDNKNLEPILFLGYLPPVNELHTIGQRPKEQPSYPAQLLRCPGCDLVQLGLVVNPKILFPPEYPYTSSTTKVLRDNFAELYKESQGFITLNKNDLVIDIGSNDGNLLSNFKGNARVLGITPENIGSIAISKGIPTILDYFTKDIVNHIKNKYGKAKIITATNVFAHIDNINDTVDLILELLDKDGVLILESHYLMSLIETLQYDTIYHEHLRYYSLHSLKYLLENHGLEIIHAKEIPTHGGSLRTYAARKGAGMEIRNTVSDLLSKEQDVPDTNRLSEFKNRVVTSKLQLYSLLLDIKKNNGRNRIYGISAPSRASTLINYVGIDDGILDCVVEIKGSHKIGKYIPGTLIPIVDEVRLIDDQPEYALILSWHIAGELIPKLKEKGYKGKFIVPLPVPVIV